MTQQTQNSPHTTGGLPPRMARRVNRRFFLARLMPQWVRHRELAIGVTGIVVIAVVGALAPLVTRFAPLSQDVSAILSGPSARHWLGTDQLGRDVFSRLVYSIRIDLPIAIASVLAPFIIGAVIGLVAGYAGRALDAVMMRIGEIVLAFPFMVLVIALVFVYGSGAMSILIAFTIVDWVSYMIIVRGDVITEKRREYVAAARVLGFSRRRIMFRHLLPNVITQAIVYSMSDVVMTITSIVGLGFLGLGIAPPTPEWGSMIQDGTPFLSSHWLIAGAPGIAVVITGLMLSLIGDGLADRLRVE